MARTALVMKTHFWDGFARRQLDRLMALCRDVDVHVLVDETNGPVAGIDHEAVCRVHASQIAELGLVAEAREGAVFWFNGDYLMYLFAAENPGYDQYLFVEYDVALTMEVDAFADRAAARGDDLVARFPDQAEPWFWAEMHRPLYGDDVRQALFPICLASRATLAFLLQRRRALSEGWRAGTLPVWPFCEAFIGTESSRAGFRLGDIAAYGDSARMEWWPPFREADLGRMPAGAFIHPVLDDPRYVQSVLKYDGAAAFFRPGSTVNVKLRGMPPHAYVPALSARLLRKLRRRAVGAAALAALVMACGAARAQAPGTDLNQPGTAGSMQQSCSADYGKFCNGGSSSPEFEKACLRQNWLNLRSQCRMALRQMDNAQQDTDGQQ